jgi:hypothetical protein
VRTWGNGAGVTGHAEIAYYAGTSPGVSWVNANVTRIFQVQPTTAACVNSTASTSTPHEIMNVLMADGSVRTATASISLAAWRAIITPNGGEVLGLD